MCECVSLCVCVSYAVLSHVVSCITTTGKMHNSFTSTDIHFLSQVFFHRFYFLFIYLFILSFFAISWADPAAYGGSQARGPIGAVATGLRQSHSNAESEPRLQPTPQLTATPDR